MKINFYKIALLISLCVSSYSFAIELNDSDLFIKSDKLTLNQKQQSATFTGNVRVYFEDMQLQTSQLIVYYEERNNKKNITRIVIPAGLTAIKEHENEIVMADSGVYDIPESKLTLTGNVKMQRNDHILATGKMVYFTDLKQSDPDKKNNAK
jgi:lipopolysaccharide transport protein LptA